MRALLLSSLAAVFVLAGCSAETADREAADLTRGKQTFAETCGACHVLAAAGTQGQIGPNLDDAFGHARGDGFDTSTFFEVTLEQMSIPAPPMPDYDEQGTDVYLDEEERVNVAAYVAACAGDSEAAGCGGG